MQGKTKKFVTFALVPAAVLAFASCSTKTPGESRTTVSTRKGVPGGVKVETYELAGKVTAIDAFSRKATLVTADGAETVITAGPDAVNFGQIQIGDQVKAMVARQTVVFMRERGAPSNDGEAALVALAPVGAKPAGAVANMVEVTGQIAALDLKRREVTLYFPSGRSGAFPVRKDVDMSKAKIGDEVVIRVTEALAISVEKP